MTENKHMDQSSELQTDVQPDERYVPKGLLQKLTGYLSLIPVPRVVSSTMGRLFSIANRAWHRFKLEVSQLSFSQWCYFIAIINFFSDTEGDWAESPKTLWVGLIAGLGLMRELWILFHRIWQKTLGKGVLLVLYAATANFALAVSALKINDIAGIEPTPFIFTLGFTTLTMLPFWIIMASVLFFAIALVVQTTWLVVGLLLRIIRIKIRMHWEDEGFAVLTVIFRLILTPVVIVALTKFAGPYMEQVNFMDSPSGLFSVSDSRNQGRDNINDRPVLQLFGESSEAVQEIIEQAKAEQLAQQNTQNPSQPSEDSEALMGEVERQRDLDQLIAALPYFENLSAINVPLNFSLARPVSNGSDPIKAYDESNTIAINSEGNEVEEENPQADVTLDTEIVEREKNRDLDKLIAAFIFHFETYSNSMCKKEPHQHSLVIDENSVLLVEKSDTELGYTFSVEACVYVFD
jgi:hypothetical protein